MRSFKRCLSVFVLAGFLCQAVGCGTARGPDAVKKMSAVEKAFLNDKLVKILFKMSEGEVVAVLGPPAKCIRIPGHDGSRMEWVAPDGLAGRCYVYFDSAGAYSIRWIKLGSFFWENQLWESQFENKIHAKDTITTRE